MMIKSRSGLALGFLVASTTTWCRSGVVNAFPQPGLQQWRIQQLQQQQQQRKTAKAGASERLSSRLGSRGCTRDRGGVWGGVYGRLYAKPADPPSSSAAPGKKEEEQKSGEKKRSPHRRRPRSSSSSSSSSSSGRGGGKALVKQAVEAWADDSLDLRRFQGKRVHVCEAETLPEVLSEFWKLASDMAQEKYSAMSSDREYAGHALFVVARCDLLRDYGMMRHLDKVLDFCSGGCSDFGRTVTLQHYHPDFVLPPSRTRSTDDANSEGFARVVNFSRSPYPIFGLTASAGSPVRSESIEVRADKIARLRMDLELVYNSVAGRSTDDNVDSHGSLHGTIPSSPEEVEDKTLDWLFGLPASTSTAVSGNNVVANKEKNTVEGVAGDDAGGVVVASIIAEAGGKASGHAGAVAAGEGAFNACGSPSLTSSYEGGLVTSGVNTPEKTLSEVWSIVAQLQKEAAPLLVAAQHKNAAPPSSPSLSISSSPASAASAKTGTAADSAPAAVGAAAAAAAGAAALAAMTAAVEQWTATACGQPEKAIEERGGEEAMQQAASPAEPAGEGEGEVEVEVEEMEVDYSKKPLVSTLLVTPRLHPFNAAQFDKFARNLAIALTQAPITGRIEIEVYHPELVCDGGVVDLARRSPFPTLLLKHCGLKDVLFEPSGKFRHALPPLNFPLDNDDDNDNTKSDEDHPSSPDASGAGDVPAEDAQL
ncbi:unnamed protein product [Pylaiella littoralis]